MISTYSSFPEAHWGLVPVFLSILCNSVTVTMPTACLKVTITCTHYSDIIRRQTHNKDYLAFAVFLSLTLSFISPKEMLEPDQSNISTLLSLGLHQQADCCMGRLFIHCVSLLIAGKEDKDFIRGDERIMLCCIVYVITIRMHFHRLSEWYFIFIDCFCVAWLLAACLFCFKWALENTHKYSSSHTEANPTCCLWRGLALPASPMPVGTCECFGWVELQQELPYLKNTSGPLREVAPIPPCGATARLTPQSWLFRDLCFALTFSSLDCECSKSSNKRWKKLSTFARVLLTVASLTGKAGVYR